MVVRAAYVAAEPSGFRAAGQIDARLPCAAGKWRNDSGRREGVQEVRGSSGSCAHEMRGGTLSALAVSACVASGEEGWWRLGKRVYVERGFHLDLTVSNIVDALPGICWRKCWDCGTVQVRQDSTLPAARCCRCGSADTRLLREATSRIRQEATRIDAIVALIDQPEVLLAIPQPYRRQLSELLHGADTRAEY